MKAPTHWIKAKISRFLEEIFILKIFRFKGRIRSRYQQEYPISRLE